MSRDFTACDVHYGSSTWLFKKRIPSCGYEISRELPDGTGICIENGIRKITTRCFLKQLEAFARICGATCLEDLFNSLFATLPDPLPGNWHTEVRLHNA